MSADNEHILEAGGRSLISSRDDVTTTATPQAGPFLNHDVIGHICKFLGTCDIKNCRLVSSCWNYGATPVLKSRTRTTLNFSPGCDDNGDPFVGEDLGGWDISDVVQMLEFCPLNVRLSIPSTQYNLPRPDFAIFPLVNNFKSIIVEYPLENQFRWEQELFTKLILSASTTLEELESDWLEDEVPLDFPPLGGTVFPKLKKLEADRFFDSDDAAERIGDAVSTLFPNINYLKTKCDYLLATLDDGRLPNFPRSLTCLKLGGDLDTNRLECLLKVPAGLKKLAFGESYPVDLEIDARVDEVPTILYKLLKKHAPTLEELDLDVEWMDGEKILQWKFPVFPVLKKLCIVLSIYCNQKESSRVEAFLPEEMNGQVVPSVKDVDVRIFNYRLDVIARIKIYVRLLAIFPNARDHVVAYLQTLMDLV